MQNNAFWSVKPSIFLKIEQKTRFLTPDSCEKFQWKSKSSGKVHIVLFEFIDFLKVHYFNVLSSLSTLKDYMHNLRKIFKHCYKDVEWKLFRQSGKIRKFKNSTLFFVCPTYQRQNGLFYRKNSYILLTDHRGQKHEIRIFLKNFRHLKCIFLAIFMPKIAENGQKSRFIWVIFQISGNFP